MTLAYTTCKKHIYENYLHFFSCENEVYITSSVHPYKCSFSWCDRGYLFSRTGMCLWVWMPGDSPQLRPWSDDNATIVFYSMNRNKSLILGLYIIVFSSPWKAVKNRRTFSALPARPPSWGNQKFTCPLLSVSALHICI